MATLADSLISSSSRPLGVRMRPDLVAKKQKYHGRVYWVIKEPIGLNYYRFEEEEYAILKMLDGVTSLDEVATQFEKDFPPQTIRVEELQQFIGTLHRSGLVTSASPGQGVQLKKRRDDRRKKELIGASTNVLSIRFRGFDPETFLNFLYPLIKWFFSKPVFIFNIFFTLSALLLVLVQFDVFQSRLPSFESFFAARNWLLIALIMGVTKVMHEFGHGLSCKHFGGECHEMGVLMLVLTPCLYCNVSDSWMLPNRWRRAAIGAAGMYVEIVLASLATYLWWFSEPGPLNFVCLNIMFVSSVSTILFNANPLLRYDGYYILSDLIEIPNLRQKASTILNRKLGKWCLGLEEPEDPFLPKRKQWFFALYTFAAMIYRWVVVFSILFFLNKVFEPYGLKVLGQIIAMFALYGLFIQPLWKAYKFFAIPGRLGKVKRKHMYTTLAILFAGLASVLFIPLPASVYCPLVVDQREADSVYIEVPGTLVSLDVKAGQYVKKGEQLAQLRNVDMDLEIAQKSGELKSYNVEIAVLLRQDKKDERLYDHLARLRAARNTSQEQLAQLKKDYKRLTIVSPRDGYVIPPPPNDGRTAPGVLAQWSGTPLDPENVGALLMPGDQGLFCRIGDRSKLEARLVIDQSDIEFVIINQEVNMLLEQNMDNGIEIIGAITDRPEEKLKVCPRQLSNANGGPIPTKMSQDGMAGPINASYQATVPIDDTDNLLRPGLIGTAKIKTRNRTLASRLWRYLSATFSFEL